MKNKLIPKHQNASGPLEIQEVDWELIPEYTEYSKTPYKEIEDFPTWLKKQIIVLSNNKNEKVSEDKRSKKQRDKESKQGEAIYSQKQRKEQEAKINKGIATIGALGALALAQTTPAAPFIDAAFATHGALGLAKQADEGTLGLNLETGLHALEMTPLALKGIGKTGKRLITQADNYITNSTNPKMLYVRYYLTGPLKFGSEVELPVLYRRTPKLSMQSGMSKKLIVTPPKNRFMFKDGTQSPVITNFTTDHPVISNNGGDWTGMTVHAFPGKILLGKNVISTRPQDTFTYGDIISVPKKLVKSIHIGENGAATTTIPESQLTLYIRKNFRTPTLKDYEFMDYVFKPKYKNGVINNDINKSMLSLDKELDPVLGSIYTNGDVYLRTKPVFDTSNVLYDPAPTVDAEFRKLNNIILKPTLGSKINIK